MEVLLSAFPLLILVAGIFRGRARLDAGSAYTIGRFVLFWCSILGIVAAMLLAFHFVHMMASFDETNDVAPPPSWDSRLAPWTGAAVVFFSAVAAISHIIISVAPAQQSSNQTMQRTPTRRSPHISHD